MRAICCIVLLLLCLPACSRSEPLSTANPAPNNALRVHVLDASGKPVPGARLEPSWGQGTVSSETQAALLPVGQGKLVIRLESGEIMILPWELPATDAKVEIILYPVTAKPGKPLNLELPAQMGTGFVWHPLNPDSGCKQGDLEKRPDVRELVGGPGVQHLICPGRPAGKHAEGFVLARFGKTAGLEDLSYPTENSRTVYRVAVFPIAVQ